MIDNNFFRDLLRYGKIKAVKVVKVYRIPKEEIDRLIDKHRKEDEGK